MISRELERVGERRGMKTFYDATVAAYGPGAGMYTVRFSTGGIAYNVPGPSSIVIGQAVTIAKTAGENTIISDKPRFTGSIMEVEV